VRIVERAHDDIGEGEDLDASGQGTNRSAYCDRVNARFGSPLGSPWCANAGAGWWKDGGRRSCRRTGELRIVAPVGVPHGIASATPQPGYAVLYGDGARASIWELVARLVRI
jgi:hypothetical protein